MPKINIDKELYEKSKRISESAGYSSVEEFISHLLEKAVKSTEADDNDEEVIKRLQGLGYIS
jgi:metal-responsive CopG/Arc/MetJ family transcriptional regulator